MIIYGVTGTRRGGTSDQLRALRELTAEVPPDEAHHGDCVGVDEEFAAMMRDLHGAYIVGHPPTTNDYRAFFDSDEEWDPRPFLYRDADVVSCAQHMFALPKGFKEERRSGTWATIRMSLETHTPLTIIFPDGSTKVETRE